MRASLFASGFIVASAVLPVASAHAEVAPVESAANTPQTQEAMVVFQMADGKFFHPGTGIIAATEAEVRTLVLGPQVSETIPEPPAAVANVPDPLVLALREARQYLQAQIVADAANQGSRVTKTEEEWRSVTLGIWDTQQQRMDYAMIERKGAQIRLPAETKAKYPALKLVRSNGVNSAFQVDADARYMVVALRHPVLRSMNSKRTLFTVEDVVYTPYSSALHTPAVVKEGELYLDTLVDGVYAQLRAEAVASRAYPDRLLVDVIDPAMLKAIAAIEHLGEEALEADTNRALEQFFVILGGNQGDAYNYSRSSAGALGLVQFIPSTYNALAARSGGKLDASFERAMTSHATAIRAQVMYLDVLLTEFPSSIRSQFAENPERTNEYIVAAYNGGSGRVRRAVEIWDQVLSGEKTRQLAKLKRDYDTAFTEAERLRQATLKEQDAKKRAASQKKLDAQRVVYRGLKTQITKLEAALLRPETIGYVEKYRLAKADGRFSHREEGIGTSAASVQPASVTLSP